ncbi:transglutaminase domain-containing protein [Paenibacillus sp. GCM10027627]|uniref:transglutaminase domain-containing protein n=1 Tax=unclassified Paenibacillus TaxID=185978 RepID=UPI00362D8278
MRKVAARLLILLVIIAAAYSLELKLDLFPATAETKEASQLVQGDETMREKLEGPTEVQGPYSELELKLAEGFKARSDRFSASYTGDKSKLSDNMTSIIRAALTHDDYSAYVLESYVYTIRSWGNKSTVTVEARYRETIEETAQVDAAVGKALADILRPGMNDHEKVKAIHDWIVTKVEYDQSLSYYTAYNAVSLGKAVCQGYSLLGYRMLKEAGITVRIAEGSVNTGEHAWNMVQLDGKWYHLDLTWDDPVGAKDNRIRYTYYLKTDEELRADHNWTRTYPAASTTYSETLNVLEQQSGEQEALRYNKLKLSLGLHWLEDAHTVADSTELRESIHSAVRSRTSHLQFRYPDGESFPDELKAAFEGIGVAVGYRASYEPFGGGQSLIVNIHLNYP